MNRWATPTSACSSSKGVSTRSTACSRSSRQPPAVDRGHVRATPARRPGQSRAAHLDALCSDRRDRVEAPPARPRLLARQDRGHHPQLGRGCDRHARPISRGRTMSKPAYRYLLPMWDGGGTVAPELGVARRLIARGHSVHVLADPTIRHQAEDAGCTFTPWVQAPHRTSSRPRPGSAPRLGDGEPAGDARSSARSLHRRSRRGVRRGYGRRDRAGSARRRRPTTCCSARSSLRSQPGCRSFRSSRTSGRCRARACQRSVLGSRWPRAGPVGVVIRRFERRSMLSSGAAAGAERGTGDTPTRCCARSTTRCSIPAGSSCCPAHLRLRLAGRASQRQLHGSDPRRAGVGRALERPEPAEPCRPVGARRVQLDLPATGPAAAASCRWSLVAAGARIVTLGPTLQPGDVLPAHNVEVVPSAPHGPILRDASLAITHCGHGTVMKALAHGVPMVCIPMGRDQNDTAARVVHHGAGIRLSPRSSATRIAAAAREVLTDPRFRDNATPVRDRGGSPND